jgi:hypothetical protein
MPSNARQRVLLAAIQQIASRQQQILSHVYSHRGRGYAIHHNLQVAETGEPHPRDLPRTSHDLNSPALCVLLSALAFASAAHS